MGRTTRTTHRLIRAVFVAMVLLPLALHADQYKSETRELEQAPPPKPQQSPEQLLKATTDPYAKALLLRDLAAEAAQKKDYGRAAQYLEQALKQGSLSGIAAQQMRDDLAQLYIASGDVEKVIASLEPAVRNNPHAPPAQQAALGAAYARQERYREALPLLQKAVASSPNPEASWLRALVAAQLGVGEEGEAAKLLQRLVRQNPGEREPWLQSAALYLKSRDLPHAVAMLELAARQGFLNTPEERLQLVGAMAQSGAPYEAGSVLQDWLERGQVPQTADNWKTLAQLWIAARESGLALQALDRTLAASPSATLYLQAGQLHLQREEYAQAETSLRKAIEGGARSGSARMALGLAAYQQGDADGALAAFRAALDDPASRAQAEPWVNYLQTDAARRQAQAAARERAPTLEQGAEQATATPPNPLQGPAVSVTGPGEELPSVRSGAGAYTPIGAEAAGNADGTLPAWTGGITPGHWPAGFKRGERLKDPFPDEKPLFTITAANAAQYAAHLSDGHKALLARYPDYKMPVYPTHRTASYPQAIYDATQANIGKARLLGSDALTGAHLGFPFPRPQNGVEAMWNHRVRYRGDSVQAISTQAVVRPNGDITSLLKQTERVYYRYANIEDPVDLSEDNILLYYLTWFTERGGSGRSGRSADFLALAHETANSIEKARAIWVLPPQLNRLFRIPPVGYDQPFPGSDGLSFVDMIDMYNGAFDRYVWKLTGKRELYIPYNGYRISDGRYKYSQLLTPKHFNQDATRYELHRVWVIEATERPGHHHSFGKRMFYVDEDTWNVVLVENDDRDGKLWRLQEGHLLALYDSQSANCIPVVTYDLKDGRYFANRLIGEDPPPEYNPSDISERDFVPDTVRHKYSR